jgi:hypothetical protein
MLFSLLSAGLMEVVFAVDIVVMDVLQRILAQGAHWLLLQPMFEHVADVVQPVGTGQVAT